MQPFRFGIVGQGFIAGVIVNAIASSRSGELTVVSSHARPRPRVLRDGTV